MADNNPVKEKILNAAEKRMVKFGYRKVTMDGIAQDLTMSKNTIYKFFKVRLRSRRIFFTAQIKDQ